MRDDESRPPVHPAPAVPAAPSPPSVSLIQPTGRGVRIAVIDSGVHAAHPHVGGVAGGLAFAPDGRAHEDFVDRLGHGTAVIAAIREKAPDASIFAVKVFDRALATSIMALVRAIDWAVAQEMHVVNLSLGTTNPGHDEVMRDAAGRAARRGVRIVSARPAGEERWLPGALPDVVGVEVDWAIGRDQFALSGSAEAETLMFHASGYPRDIPGVPRERNLKGVSFAVANMTGFVAQALERAPDLPFDQLVARLRARAVVRTRAETH